MSYLATRTKLELEYELAITKSTSETILPSWLKYLEYSKLLVYKERRRSIQDRIILLRRALKVMPGSYKLWKILLGEVIEVCEYYRRLDHNTAKDNDRMFVDEYDRAEFVKEYCKSHGMGDSIPSARRVWEYKLRSMFERSLVYMKTMPVIWKLYIEQLTTQGQMEMARYSCDRAIQSLPITQHHHIWPMYLEVADKYVQWQKQHEASRPKKKNQKDSHRNDLEIIDFWMVHRFGSKEEKGDAEDVPLNIIKRYSKFDPKQGKVKLFYAYMEREMYNDAAVQISALFESLNQSIFAEEDEKPNGDENPSKDHVNAIQRRIDQRLAAEQMKREKAEIWMNLITTCIEHSSALPPSLDIAALIRGAIQYYTRSNDQNETEAEAEARAILDKSLVDLWIMLAEYYASKGWFEHCRDVFDEALSTTSSVSDFAVLFDAYMKLEESLTSQLLERMEEAQAEQGAADHPSRLLLQTRLDMSMARLEHLIEQRPFLLSEVSIRQDPHNVHEWHKRAKLYVKAGKLDLAIKTYEEAVGTIDPWKSSMGKPHTLWLAFSRLYEAHDDLESAREVLENALEKPERFRYPEDVVQLWCEYVEMELRHQEFENARDLASRACQPVNERSSGGQANALALKRLNAEAALGMKSGHVEIAYDYSHEKLGALRFWRSPKLWNLRLDLEQSLGQGVEASVWPIYESMISSKVATIDMVFEAADFLESRQYFEKSFQLLEKAIQIFPWPGVLPIWIRYLTNFYSRYGDTKVERIRDLYETALKSAPSPSKEAKTLMLMYAEVEERLNFPVRALNIYKLLLSRCPTEDISDMIRLYVSKSCQLFGLGYCRPVLEQALTDLSLSDDDFVEFAWTFATIEEMLGEIDRARALYKHGSQAADPKRGANDPSHVITGFWAAWKQFELAHGSEDTFRDMLRIQRTVQTYFSKTYMAMPNRHARRRDLELGGKRKRDDEEEDAD